MSYDILMLLVLVAAALWGYWKGFVWQLASLASIFSSYTLAYVLRVQVGKLIDVAPPWNMFAAMAIVYLLSSLVIWLGTAAVSQTLEAFKLKDFDRQIGATFGLAKGGLFCILITFFAVTLLGEREQARICSSTSGRFIAKALKSSGGLIPPEIAAVVDPYLTPFEETLAAHQGQTVAGETLPESVGGESLPRPYFPPVAIPAPALSPQYQPQPQPPPPDPRYADPRAYYPPLPPPGYYDPRYYAPPPAYAPPADPRYADPRYYPPAADPRYYAPPTNYPPQYAPAPTQPPPADPQRYWR